MRWNLAGASRPRGVGARAWLVAALWALSTMAMAASVPWTPSISARNAIEMLVDEGGLPLTVSQWPLPRDAVQRALDTLPAELPLALDAARAQVRAELRAQQSARIGLTLRDRKDALAGFGDDATPGSSLQLRSGEYDGPHLALQAGARLDEIDDHGKAHATPRLDDSAVAVEAMGVQAQVWAHRSWWGPGWQSALPLSNNAPALDGIGLQRAAALPSESPWLSWLGPWNMELFLARTEVVALGPGNNPLVSGLRLTARPLSHLEIGLTRIVQFGGLGHPETIGSFLRAVVGSQANAQTVEAQARDSGNGLAGIDFRARCPDGLRCAAYGQFIGEDSRKHLPYKYLDQVGMEVWSEDGTSRVYFEATETGCRNTWKGGPIPGCAYRSYAYTGGYTSAYRWLGASAGPDAHLVTLGWINSSWDSSLRIDAGRIGSRIGTSDNDMFATVPGPFVAVSARRGWQVGSAHLTPEFDWTRVSTPTGVVRQSRFGLEMSMTLDDLGPAAPARIGGDLSSADGSPGRRLLTAGALVAGAALLDRAANSYAADHHNEPSLKVLRQAGSTLPFAELGLAGAAWLTRSGTPDGNVALASVEAGLTSVALAEAVKLGVDRSRPSEGRGASDFGHEKRSDSSFPSVHSALAWSVLTPVAQRYDAPWLYGVAALTNVGRVAGRKHWLSDTVAGAVLGYVVGDWFGKRADAAGGGASTTVMLVPHGAVLSTAF